MKKDKTKIASKSAKKAKAKATKKATGEATLAQDATDEAEATTDATRCATLRCKGKPVHKHGKNQWLCQECWSEAAAEDEAERRAEARANREADAEEKGKKRRKAKNPDKSESGTRPKRIGALTAAAEVLKKAGKPMKAKEMITAMAEAGLWTSPNGRTPEATLYAAMMREERDKGAASRFRKVERGTFEYQEPATK